MSEFRQNPRRRVEARFPQRGRVLLVLIVIALSGALAGCQKTRTADMTPLDQAGMWFGSIDELRQAQLTDVEVQQLALARQAGLSDDACVALIRIAHSRQQPFVYGQAVAGLASAGFHPNSILELARLNLLGSWAGEAQIMRLANLSDEVVLAVARRKVAGLPVMSGDRVAQLRNAGLSEKEILGYIEEGISDHDADEFLSRRNYAAAGHSFVHETGRRR